MSKIDNLTDEMLDELLDLCDEMSFLIKNLYHYYVVQKGSPSAAQVNVNRLLQMGMFRTSRVDILIDRIRNGFPKGGDEV